MRRGERGGRVCSPYSDFIINDTTKEQKTTFAKERSKPGRWRCGVVHAWVGQIVTFFATAPLAAPWAP